MKFATLILAIAIPVGQAQEPVRLFAAGGLRAAPDQDLKLGISTLQADSAGDYALAPFARLAFVCIIHTMRSADVIAKLKKTGWKLRAVKGSHRIYTHPGTGVHLSVPHPKKDLGTGLVHKLLKQAGLKK